MSRRELVRISLGAEGRIAGPSGSLVCTVVEMSAGGARIAFRGRLPRPPLRLTFTVGGETAELPIVIHRLPAAGAMAVRFPRAQSERLQRLIAAEQRDALVAGRRITVERRRRRSPPGTVRGEVL